MWHVNWEPVSTDDMLMVRKRVRWDLSTSSTGSTEETRKNLLNILMHIVKKFLNY